MTTVTGIDVSHHQGVIDWAAVATSGHAFAVVRASRYTGSIGPDRRFRANWAGARRAGLLRTAYHYAAPGASPAIDQARLFAGTVGPLDRFDLPLVLDLEETRLSPAATADWAADFLDELDRLTGRRSILYTSPGFAGAHLAGPAMARLAGRPLWVAHYTAAERPRQVPGLRSDWLWWQHTSTGRCPGIAGDVDLNRCSIDLTALRALALVTTPTPDPDDDQELDVATAQDILNRLDDLDDKVDRNHAATIVSIDRLRKSYGSLRGWSAAIAERLGVTRARAHELDPVSGPRKED